jgi:hypothetical protein
VDVEDVGFCGKVEGWWYGVRVYQARVDWVGGCLLRRGAALDARDQRQRPHLNVLPCGVRA